MAVKKAFVDLVSFLEDNSDKKVKSILPDVITMCSAKSGGGGGGASSFHRNADGEVVAIRCYYHKLWMDPRKVEFGAKANSATGLNTMCKDGVSKWTKQQRDAKKAKEQLLADVASGEVDPSTLTDALAEIDATSARIEPREDGYGFETLEECLNDSGEAVPETA